MNSGSAVREAINQGFTRAELGSLADKQATQVYHGAKAEGSVVAAKCTNAIENYQAAVACFLRALPSLTDARSADLVRAEIRRLLARLGELKTILRATDPENELLQGLDGLAGSEADAGVKNRLLQDLRFQVGDEVEVDEKRPGKIAGVDLEQGTYEIEYDDGSRERESRVIESRVRLRPLKPLPLPGDTDQFGGFSSANEAERHRLWSEVVESERAYQVAMQHIINSYLIPLDSPSQWGGSKASGDTVFTQKSITKEERKAMFGNIEDLAGMSALVLEALEGRFLMWEKDQKLADVFLELSAMYNNGYPLFAETHSESLTMLATMRRDRSSFESVEQRARMLGAPALDELLRLPLARPSQMRQLMQSLAQRTSDDHPDMSAIRDTFVMFGRVEEAMRFSLNRAKLEKQVTEVECLFSPALKLLKKGRYLVKFSDHLKRIEGSKITPRCVWLFSDMCLVGRKSEWLNVGSYRHLGQISLVKARQAPEYGPLAFEMEGSAERFVFTADDEHDKQEWLKALRGYLPQPPVGITNARRKSRSLSGRNYATVGGHTPTPSSTNGSNPLPPPSNAAKPPPPPPPPAPASKVSTTNYEARPTATTVDTTRYSSSGSGMPPPGAMPTAFMRAGTGTNGSVNQKQEQPIIQPSVVPMWGAGAQGGRPSSSATSSSTSQQILGAATMKQKEVLLNRKRSSSPASPAPVAVNWYRAQAIANFEPMEIGDLRFKRGDVLEIYPEETSAGWSRGRVMGGDGVEGAVPSSYLQRL